MSIFEIFLSTLTKVGECRHMYLPYPFRVLGLLELLVGGAVVGTDDKEQTREGEGEGKAAASSTMLLCSFRNSFRKSD